MCFHINYGDLKGFKTSSKIYIHTVFHEALVDEIHALEAQHRSSVLFGKTNSIQNSWKEGSGLYSWILIQLNLVLMPLGDFVTLSLSPKSNSSIELIVKCLITIPCFNWEGGTFFVCMLK